MRGGKIELKRGLGLLEVTFSGMGVILGAGIYALIGEAAGLAGNAVWLSFVLAALVAVFTGLSYAELASLFPKASAEYEYIGQAFNRNWAFIIGWLIISSGVISTAAVALGFAGYFRAISGMPLVSSALLLIALLALVNFAGVKQSAWLAISFTLIESLGLVIIILIGLPFLGSVDYLEMPSGFSGIFQAAALIFFAFIGFEEMVKLSEETREPEKTIPRALILAVSASIILYILVALSAISVLGWQKLSQSSAPFADIAFVSFGQNAFFILSAIALFATANTVLLMLLAASRIIYGMAESASLPKVLSRVYPSTGTPWVAILLAAVLAMAFVFLEDIAFVANVNNFTLFLTFISVNAAVIVLRYKKPEMNRPFRVPLSLGKLPLIPAFGIIFNFFLLLQLSREAMAMGLGLVILGAVATFASRDRRRA